jgi:hypothetical protein
MKMQSHKPPSAGAGNKETKPKNYVHDSIIRTANIKKENHFQQYNRSENYQMNPYNCSHLLTEFTLTTRNRRK